MRSPRPRPRRKPWELNTRDFFHEKVYAQKRTRRYELFFNYLRISPSYFVAVFSESEEQLAARLGDAERAEKVWNTRQDVGNVYNMMFKEWWLTCGINLFGVHTRRPEVRGIAYLTGNYPDRVLVSHAEEELGNFLRGRYEEQGRPDSILISVPLGQSRIKTSRELYDILKQQEERFPVSKPVPKYQLEQNKIQDQRLMLGYNLAFFKAVFPSWELWRVGAHARISKKHAALSPLTDKKDIHNAEARRGLTMIASRMYKETLTIAENAAIGKFPSLEPIELTDIDLRRHGRELSRVESWENEERRRMESETR